MKAPSTRPCPYPRDVLPAGIIALALAAGCSSEATDQIRADVSDGHSSGGAATSTGGRAGTGGAQGGAAASDAGRAVPDAAPEGTGGTPEGGGAPGSDGGGGPLPEAGEVPEPFTCNGTGARFATSAVAHEFGPGQSHGQDAFPAPLLGPPRGAGSSNGSLDVVSLGNGGTVTVAFEGNGIVDGPGADFIVFENAFFASGDPDQPFAELGTVAVSDDGTEWHEYPCTAVAAPFGSCSGARPVFANADENDIDPFDAPKAGGDPYDLADLGLSRVRFVRITDRADLTGLNGVYDLDAVAILNPACP